MTERVIAPTGPGAVGPYAAGVAGPGADRSELPLRRRVVTPAFDGAVGPHPTDGAPVPPMLTEANSPSGIQISPEVAAPQQTTAPSLLTPQVVSSPALMEANSPSGGVALPLSSLPQHRIEPSRRTPQVWAPRR